MRLEAGGASLLVMDAVAATRVDWGELLDAAAHEIAPEIVEIRRCLHMHPEASGEEYGSVEMLRSRFAKAGLEPRAIPTGNGLIVDGPPPAGASRIAFRADLDALRMHDVKTAVYRSRRDGVMHACGHDAPT